jgi:hypothetical protein
MNSYVRLHLDWLKPEGEGFAIYGPCHPRPYARHTQPSLPGPPNSPPSSTRVAAASQIAVSSSWIPGFQRRPRIRRGPPHKRHKMSLIDDERKLAGK